MSHSEQNNKLLFKKKKKKLHSLTPRLKDIKFEVFSSFFSFYVQWLVIAFNVFLSLSFSFSWASWVLAFLEHLVIFKFKCNFVEFNTWACCYCIFWSLMTCWSYDELVIIIFKANDIIFIWEGLGFFFF